MSRRCPKCKTVYAGEARFCPKDGSPLVDVGGAGGAPVVQEPTASRTQVRRVATPKPGLSLSRAGSLANQELDGRYKIMRKLGEGGMSYVYEAQDAHTSIPVAIKVLSPKLSRDQSSVLRLRREAGLAMRLEHPNVCRILRLGETEDGLIYLVMPFLEGELLSDRETKAGPMDPETGVAILTQTCAGLHYAHELNIIHRDLKPENIMLVPDADGERAVVMDFGLAKENRAEGDMAKLTATGIILGTPEFMSPEQIRGKTLDARSDVYALGIVGFEMFTGKLPFTGRTPQEMMISRLRGQPTPIKQVRADFPQKLGDALMRCLEPDPDKRYPDTMAMGHALVDALESANRDQIRTFLK